MTQETGPRVLRRQFHNRSDVGVDLRVDQFSSEGLSKSNNFLKQKNFRILTYWVKEQSRVEDLQRESVTGTPGELSINCFTDKEIPSVPFDKSPSEVREKVT